MMTTQNKLDKKLSTKMSDYISTGSTRLKNIVTNLKCNEVLPVFRASNNTIETKI
jgi:hypothetical protein